MTSHGILCWVFMYVISFSPGRYLGRYYYCLHFTDDDLRIKQILTDLPKDIQANKQYPGFELCLLTENTLSIPSIHHSLKIKEWINLGHKGRGVNKGDD